MSRHRSVAASLALLAAIALAGCAGPTTFLDNDGGHRCYVDGRLETRPILPFRYYGTSRVDVIPRPRPDGRPDWSRLSMSQALVMEEPASPWLFPFDFVLEAAGRLFDPDPSYTVLVTPPATPLSMRAEEDVRPQNSEQVRRRVEAARISR